VRARTCSTLDSLLAYLLAMAVELTDQAPAERDVRVFMDHHPFQGASAVAATSTEQGRDDEDVSGLSDMDALMSSMTLADRGLVRDRV